MILARIRPAIPSTRSRLAHRLPRPRAAAPRASASAPAAAAAGGVALGAILAFFLDPRAGRRRRHAARDRVLSRARRGERRALARARRAESHAVGIARRTFNARRFRRREPLDDVTLAHKVESELYRHAGVPKGQIVVNAEYGVVFLRGVLEQRTSRAWKPRCGGSRAFRKWRACCTCPARRRRPADRSSNGSDRASDGVRWSGRSRQLVLASPCRVWVR